MFLYLQTVSGPAGRNTFEAGLEDVKSFELEGAYGYDHAERGQPSVSRAYLTEGNPWTVVIDKQGVVAYSKWTQLGLKPIQDAIDGARRSR